MPKQFNTSRPVVELMLVMATPKIAALKSDDVLIKNCWKGKVVGQSFPPYRWYEKRLPVICNWMRNLRFVLVFEWREYPCCSSRLSSSLSWCVVKVGAGIFSLLPLHFSWIFRTTQERTSPRLRPCVNYPKERRKGEEMNKNSFFFFCTLP